VLGLSTSLAACGQPSADSAPVFGEFELETAAVTETLAQDLAVWPADAELRDLLLAVAPRIERATGLVVTTTEDTNAGPPLFWATRRTDDDKGWLGLTHVDDERRPEWLAIDPRGPVAVRETVVLHEVLHALGADHVRTGEGVLSPEIWDAFPITEADLEALCAVRDCPTFAPEVAVMP
jgi:hypothetical protein